MGGGCAEGTREELEGKTGAAIVTLCRMHASKKKKHVGAREMAQWLRKRTVSAEGPGLDPSIRHFLAIYHPLLASTDTAHKFKSPHHLSQSKQFQSPRTLLRCKTTS